MSERYAVTVTCSFVLHFAKDDAENAAGAEELALTEMRDNPPELFWYVTDINLEDA